MSSKQKILILLPVFDLGGAEKQGLYIAKSLQESGQYEVEVWAFYKGTGLLLVKLEEANLKCRLLNIPFSLNQNRFSKIKTCFQFSLQVRKSKFDIIIPFTYYYNVLAASVFRFAGVKKCIWFQIAMEYNFPLTSLEKMAIKFKPIYAANSLAGAEFIADRHSISKDKVKFIPNPFEKNAPKSDVDNWRKKLEVSTEDIVLLMSANFYPEKDHDTLIKGLNILLKTNPKLILVFAGGLLNSAKAYQLKALAFDLKLQDKVKFIGSTDDMPGLLRAVDIGILSTRSEGSPNSLIEYMGYGLPIIATNITPVVELLGKNYPYLFKVEDVDDFVSKIEKSSPYDGLLEPKS